MHAVICGAGIAGLSAALSLHRHGWRVSVVEQAPRLRDGGYMIDFFGPGYAAAERIGVLDALHALAHEVDAATWADWNGRVRARLHYARMRQVAQGRLLSLLRGDLERALFAALPPGVDLRFDARISEIVHREDGVTLRIDTGGNGKTGPTTEEMNADLLVGADGVHSSIRSQVFGTVIDPVRPLGLHTAAWFARADGPVRDAVGRDFAIMNAPGRMAAGYDVGDERIAAFFVYTDAARHAPVDPLAEIRARYRSFGGFVPHLLGIPPQDEVYSDVVAQVQLPRWHDRRVILIGDAACAVSLIAGQGASIALAMGVALGETLAVSGRDAEDGDVDAALAEFEERVRPGVEATQANGRRTAAWFVPTNRLRIVLRNAMMRVADFPPALRLVTPLGALRRERL
ncbi:FAD-dependent monooxygenase [Microbacterium sp. LRZ72]|uniref:FAD-dependent oxidoreductase n=1 Tax=Microbacterium sp. LRZ72 TaxID=2942481 RepID=UPI0029ABDAAB|nr:FAD-dependent oxidoreductase [Microbacterium sp. LRZ72]MDX2376245.1 FAD-dependent monooxygenase [Microbacterium sp. LRZ72]